MAIPPPVIPSPKRVNSVEESVFVRVFINALEADPSPAKRDRDDMRMVGAEISGRTCDFLIYNQSHSGQISSQILEPAKSEAIGALY
jgi:hypothetical protein